MTTLPAASPHDHMTNSDEFEQLRRQEYNATVTEIRFAHSELMIARIRHDQPLSHIEPGQYLTLGLGVWEPRCDNVPSLLGCVDSERTHVIQRAYSLSCPMLEQQQLAPVSTLPFLEFYITLVRKPSDTPPSLTPRLFALKPGDRLHCGSKPHGTYTLIGIESDHHILFLSTGTGEAPHNAMLAELLSRGHRGHLVSCVCVRKFSDLAYLHVHRELERRYSQYRYICLTTREPENLDPTHPAYVGKQYLQDFFASGQFDRLIDFSPDPARTHVFICGNPEMIGLPHRMESGEKVYPPKTGMIEILEHRGFVMDTPHNAGNIHFEKYW